MTPSLINQLFPYQKQKTRYHYAQHDSNSATRNKIQVQQVDLQYGGSSRGLSSKAAVLVLQPCGRPFDFEFVQTFMYSLLDLFRAMDLPVDDKRGRRRMSV